jgi:hypothetical protein
VILVNKRFTISKALGSENGKVLRNARHREIKQSPGHITTDGQLALVSSPPIWGQLSDDNAAVIREQNQ